METTDHAPPLTPHRHRASRAWRAIAAVLLLAAATPALAGQSAPPFLRTEDRRLAEAVLRGRDQSKTFKAILERLAASDVIIYLRRGSLAGTTAAATQFMTTAGGYRYIRVTLELEPTTDVGIAMLGHELRHVLEFADAQWVESGRDVTRLYEEIGFSTCEFPGRCYDTMAAVHTGRQVLIELRGLRRRLNPMVLPAALGEEPGADDCEAEEGDAHGDERAGGAELCAVGENPGEGDLEQPQHAEVDPGGRARIAGTVESLRQDHAVAGEGEAERDDAQAADAVAGHLGIAREDGDQPRREDQKRQADGAKTDRVVKARPPRRSLRTLWLAGTEVLTHERRSGVADAKRR
jgi:hypothetical protein